jgi:drug/metabolite transporter (DMT)-like permease
MQLTKERTMPRGEPTRLALLLGFVLVSFAANSLITRYVVTDGLLDPGLLSGVRILAGALALLVVAGIRGDRVVPGRPNVIPALALGAYAICISYGYHFIGAAAGTFIFYATVMVTMIVSDLVTRTRVPARRLVGAAVSMLGIAVLTAGKIGAVTVAGVLLLAATGVAWGIYTAEGRSGGNPRLSTTGNFILLAAVLTPLTVVGVVAGSHVSVPGVVWGVVMGAGTTAFAYVAWYACQRSMSGVAAGSAQLLIPVITTAGAVLLLGEQLSWTLLAAAVLVASGMWLNRPDRPRAAGAA